jgi:hypothetical protein
MFFGLTLFKKKLKLQNWNMCHEIRAYKHSGFIEKTSQADLFIQNVNVWGSKSVTNAP